jgi:hypothetical protein
MLLSQDTCATDINHYLQAKRDAESAKALYYATNRAAVAAQEIAEEGGA